MNTTLLLIIVIALIGSLSLIFLILSLTGSSGATRNQLRSIVSAQRESGRRSSSQPSGFVDPEMQAQRKRTTSKLTLRKRLKYGRWKIPPTMFRLAEIVLSLFAISLTSLKFNIVIQLMSLLTGPLLMNWALNFCVDRRYKKFDQDYAPMLLSLVGLLKTGMNVMGALEAAGAGLEDGSMVKEEITTMNERLRFGVSEEKSIGAFGEDIFHPEIELFVQALLLNRRVGGALSDTLDRLAKQVRKRQQFRLSAVAAVGMQRGSIWFIIVILVGLEGYLYFIYPEAIEGAWNHELGWEVWQGGMLVIILGMFWVRQVTKIRI